MPLRKLAMLLPIAPLLAGAEPPVTVQSSRAGLAGAWQGRLEYRDYDANRWFGR